MVMDALAAAREVIRLVMLGPISCAVEQTAIAITKQMGAWDIHLANAPAAGSSSVLPGCT